MAKPKHNHFVRAIHAIFPTEHRFLDVDSAELGICTYASQRRTIRRRTTDAAGWCSPRKHRVRRRRRRRRRTVGR
jgi:hypothetical protein